MRRTIQLFSLLILCSSCAELKVIGDSALRELRADAINVEQNIYRSGNRSSDAVAAADAPTSNQQNLARNKERQKTRIVAKRGLWMAGSRLN